MPTRHLCALSLLLFSTVTGCAPVSQKQSASAAAGRELLIRIDGAFGLETGLYAGELIETRPGPPAACWPAAIQLSATVAGARVEPAWRVRLIRYIDATDAYWNQTGFDASPFAQTPDRYYDDNAWMGLALLEAFELTRDVECLRRARAAAGFVLSGEDATLDGGIWWHEQTRRTKNACSTGPAIVLCLRLHEITGDPAYRAAAERLYAWMNRKLQDADGLFFDHVNATGQIDSTKFSYNSAMMIIANCELFDLTRDAAYLDQARRIAAAATRFWIVPVTGAIRDDAPFGGLLVEALLELYRRDGDRRWRQAAIGAVEHLRTRNHDRAGWHPAKWDQAPHAKQARVRLIDQSAAARAMLLADVTR